MDFNEDFFADLAADADVELLMITAGIGRVADFYAHHIAEIEKMLTVDTVSVIKILRIFYERILTEKTFYTGVMGSNQWLDVQSRSISICSRQGRISQIC